MTIYEIVRNCLFVLDKSDEMASLDTCQSKYDLYLLALIAYENSNDNQELLTALNTACGVLDSAVATMQNTYHIVEVLSFLANKILGVISVRFLPCTFSESISVSNESFDLSNLSKPFGAIKSVLNVDTNESVIDYKIVGNELRIKNGNYVIDYNFNSGNYDYFETIEDFAGCLTASSVVDGVLAEYYLINGFYEESNYYYSRFENLMQALKLKTREVRVKERVWE